jgi:hypothetical protein
MALIINETQGAASSTDFTLASASTTLSLSGPLRPFGSAQVQKLIGTNYVTIGELTDGNPARVLSATGTFRVTKGPSQNATGVDRD